MRVEVQSWIRQIVNFQFPIVKLADHRPGLPGKVISFHIVPLAPACKAGLQRHIPVMFVVPFIVYPVRKASTF